MLLSGAQAAYSSRLALVESAQKTLDLQYYAIHADVSTQRLLQSVVAAAERGVRVRVLLDDLHSTGRDAQVMRLAFVPNVEMRMFNPLTGTHSQLGRIFSLVGDFEGAAAHAQQAVHCRQRRALRAGATWATPTLATMTRAIFGPGCAGGRARGARAVPNVRCLLEQPRAYPCSR